MKRSKSMHRTEVANDPQTSVANALAGPDARAAGLERAPLASLGDAQARQEMIAQAAYFLAERRGFTAGCELDDWLRAEAETLAKQRQAAGR